MTEALIFSFGSLLFIITTSATFSFGMRRFYEIQVEDMAESGRHPVSQPDGLTELHVATKGPNGGAESAAPDAQVGDDGP